MNILITGASGFIATELIKNAPPEWSFFGLSRSGKGAAAKNYALDLSNNSSVDEFIRQLTADIDVVIHAASALADKDNVRSMSLFYENISITENLIKIINHKK